MRLFVLVVFVLRLALPGLHAHFHAHDTREGDAPCAHEAHPSCPVCEHLAKSDTKAVAASAPSAAVALAVAATTVAPYAEPFADAVHFVGEARAPPVRA